MFDVSTLLLIGLTLFSAAGFQAVTGFGFNLISTPILFLMMPPKVAVMVLVVPSLVAGWSAAYLLRKSAPWKEIGKYVLWTPVGVILGLEVLDMLPVWAMKIFLALLLLQTLLSKLGPDLLNKLHWTPLSGVLAGIAGGSLGTAGPPVVAWAHAKKTWSLEEKRAATLWTFTFINLIRVPVYGFAGELSASELWIVAGASVPVLFLGSFLGNRLAASISPRMGQRFIQAAIGVLCITLMAGAITDLSDLFR